MNAVSSIAVQYVWHTQRPPEVQSTRLVSFLNSSVLRIPTPLYPDGNSGVPRADGRRGCLTGPARAARAVDGGELHNKPAHTVPLASARQPEEEF